MKRNNFGASKNDVDPSQTQQDEVVKRASHSVDYEVDCNNISQVWLVKVPKYLANTWQSAPPRSSLGKLVLSGSLGGPKMKFISEKSRSASSSLVPSTSSSTTIEHEEYPFIVTPKLDQRMVIVSHSASSTVSNPGSMILEGEIVQKAELRPTDNPLYMQQKKMKMLESAKPTRTTLLLDKAPINCRPRTAAQDDYRDGQSKKKEVKKLREDKEIVQQRLYAAFEKKEFYAIRDLERITDQSPAYLKEILKEIGNQLRTGPNKHMWELKPEYRGSKNQDSKHKIV